EDRMNEKVGVIGAIGAAIVASICCIGPVVLAGLGIGAVAAAQTFVPYRPLFLAITAIFLGVGFYFAYRKPKQAVCEGEVCETPRVARWGRPLLWVATVVAAALVAFPYYYAPLRSALEKPVQPSVSAAQAAQLATLELSVGGMTCEGCAAAIKSKLLETPGVAEAAVHYPAGHAQVRYDPTQTDSAKLIEAVNSLGYKASLPNQN
ncbi:MAG: cation transporter, partial [Acidobacteriales bacterium]|nr:cation transporter [Terriglobales bacterium]